MNNPIEKFLPVVGYEGIYEISNLGRVKSVPRPRTKGGIIATSVSNRNKERVSLYLNGVSKTYQVHRLVAEAFLPNPNNLTDVNHIDENTLNNKLSNLEWCTHSENLRHSIGTGTIKSNLNLELARQIKNSNLSQRKLAKMYGVGQTTIWSIKNGVTWKDV